MSLSDLIQNAFEEDPLYSLALKLHTGSGYTEESLREDLDQEKREGKVLDYAARVKIIGHMRDVCRKEKILRENSNES